MRGSSTSSSSSLSYSTTTTSSSSRLTCWSWNSKCLRGGVDAVSSHVRILYHRDAVLSSTLAHLVPKPLHGWRQSPTSSQIVSSSRSSLPSWQCVLATLLVLCSCIHGQTPPLHLRSMMHSTTSMSVAQVLTGASSSSTTFPNAQLTAAVSAHPLLAAVARSRLCAALSSQTLSSSLWR